VKGGTKRPRDSRGLSAISDWRTLISVFQHLWLDLFPIFRNKSCPSTNPFLGEENPVMQYFVVMIDYGWRGREAIVDPEITRREVISRIASGEYKNISFIHEIAGSAVDDITAQIVAEAALPEIAVTGADLQAGSFDHARDLRKHDPEVKSREGVSLTRDGSQRPVAPDV
jgi:hypothetical protein